MLNPLLRYEEIQQVMGKRVPVTLLGGFLGAGKTTVLNGLLKQAAGRQLAVLVNDFGEINIDERLIVKAEGQQIQLANGCICCSIRDDLVAGLRSVLQSSPSPQQILIETSGVSDPANVVCALNGSPVRRSIFLENVVTVVAAGNTVAAESNQEFQALYEKQIRSAYTLILNRIQSPGSAFDQPIRRDLARLAPSAPVIETQDGQVPIELVLGERRLSQSAFRAEPGYEDPSHPFESLVYRTASPVRRVEFVKAMKAISSRVYRAKGFVNFHHYPRITLYQKVGAFESYTDATSWAKAQPMTELVLIGARSTFCREEIVAALAACSVEPQSTHP